MRKKTKMKVPKMSLKMSKLLLLVVLEVGDNFKVTVSLEELLNQKKRKSMLKV